MAMGRYFRMHLVGYLEGIDSERGPEWRCSDSLSPRDFLRLESRARVPDHSWLSRTRARLPHEVHAAVFDWVPALIAEAGLVTGERIGVDASTMEANAALPTSVRRDRGEGTREMLERLAEEEAVARGYIAIFVIPTPDGAFMVTLLVLQSARLGFAATFLPRERARTKRPFSAGFNPLSDFLEPAQGEVETRWR